MAEEADQLIVKFDDQATPARLIVSGDVDLDTHQQFERVVVEAIEQAGSVIVDLLDVRLLGSIGIHVLIAHQSRLHSVEARSGTLVARTLTLIEYPKLTIVEDR